MESYDKPTEEPPEWKYDLNKFTIEDEDIGNDLCLGEPRLSQSRATGAFFITFPFIVDNKEIGFLTIKYIKSDQPMVSSVETHQNFWHRKNKYGLQGYIQVGENLLALGKKIISDEVNVNYMAMRVWKSLVRRGYAIDTGKKIEGNNLFFCILV